VLKWNRKPNLVWFVIEKLTFFNILVKIWYVSVILVKFRIKFGFSSPEPVFMLPLAAWLHLKPNPNRISLTGLVQLFRFDFISLVLSLVMEFVDGVTVNVYVSRYISVNSVIFRIKFW